MQARRVAIFFWEGYLGVAPSLINAIRLLADKGYAVDIIMAEGDGSYALPPSFPPGVRLFRANEQSSEVAHSGHKWQRNRDTHGRRIFRKLRRVAVQARRFFIGQESEIYARRFFAFLTFAQKIVSGHRYTAFIGVDTNGLVAAMLLGIPKRVPLVYWSLEIRFLEEFSFGSQRFAKRLERIAHRRALLTIVQDWQRAGSLAKENRVALTRTVIIPNGPVGPPCQIDSDFFQRKFQLPSSQRIILHTGMISAEAHSLELAQAASQWPDDWTLIFHDRQKRDAHDPYLLAVKTAGGDRVRLSLDPVSYDELDQTISSGHAGLAIYNHHLGPNFTLMVGASGKLAHYLRCSLPVVGVNMPGLSDVLGKYGAGYSVNSTDEIAGALSRIFTHYDAFRAGAAKCYTNEYEFSLHFQQLLDVLDRID